MTQDPFEIATAGDGGANSWLVVYVDAITLVMAF